MLEGMVQRSFKALSDGDLETIMSWYADDAVFEFPAHSRISGRFVGKPAIEAWWRRWIDRMAKVQFTVRHVGMSNPIGFRFRNTLFVEWDVEATTKDGMYAQAAGVSVLRWRRGKVVFARDYFFDPTIEEVVWGRADEVRAA